MNRDLQATLKKLGPDYHRLVREMKAPFEDRPTARPLPRWKIGYLSAAVLAAVFGLTVWFRSAPAPRTAPRIYTIAYAATPDALRTIVASQRADGSWENDFLTRQNAAVLQNATIPDQRIAYLRAVRYLRRRGLSPFTEAELSANREQCAPARN